jgi:hypothetical protein
LRTSRRSILRPSGAMVTSSPYCVGLFRSLSLAPRGSRLGAHLLRRRSGTKKRVPSLLLSTARGAIRCWIAPLAVARSVEWLAPLAAMFAGEPPSSSDPTKRPVSENQLCSRRVSSASPADRRREHRGRGLRFCSRLLRRRSGTKSVSPLSSSARRRVNRGSDGPILIRSVSEPRMCETSAEVGLT